MRRIFTSMTLISLVLSSINSTGQLPSCSVTTVNPSPSPGFGTTYTINSGEGFSGTAGTMNVFPLNSSHSITTPKRFHYNSTQTAVYFKLRLGPNGNKSVDINSYSIAINYGTGAGVTQSSSNSSPGITIPSSGQTYYFSMSNISVPPGMDFQITLTLSLGNANGTTSNVTLSGFATNGVEPAGGTLPVKFSSLEAQPTTGAVSLEWNVATEENMFGYDIERSLDSRNFSRIGFINASGKNSYSFIDTRPSPVATYYRIKFVDANGRYNYSAVVLVKEGTSTIVLNAFPMPVVRNVTIQHGTSKKGAVITISSQDGHIIRSVAPITGTQQTTVDLSSAKAGFYLLRYVDESGKTEALKIIKQ